MKQKIFGIFVLTLLSSIQMALPVSAARVQVGDGSGNTAQFSSEAHVISEVDCVPVDNGVAAESNIQYRVVGEKSGARQNVTVTYAKAETDSPYTQAWCRGEAEKIVADLQTANLAMYSGVGERNLTTMAATGDCKNSILTWIDCDDEDGIGKLLSLVINIMTAGVVALATVGIVISGIQWLTARDNENQIVKAKSRIFNIVIGLVVWAVMWVLLNWLLPGGLGL